MARRRATAAIVMLAISSQTCVAPGAQRQLSGCGHLIALEQLKQQVVLGFRDQCAPGFEAALEEVPNVNMRGCTIDPGGCHRAEKQMPRDVDSWCKCECSVDGVALLLRTLVQHLSRRVCLLGLDP